METDRAILRRSKGCLLQGEDGEVGSSDGSSVKTGLPTGVLLSPFEAVHPPPPQLMRTPVLCVQCAAYANVYCDVDVDTGRWRCCFCSHLNSCYSEDLIGVDSLTDQYDRQQLYKQQQQLQQQQQSSSQRLQPQPPPQHPRTKYWSSPAWASYPELCTPIVEYLDRTLTSAMSGLALTSPYVHSPSTADGSERGGEGGEVDGGGGDVDVEGGGLDSSSSASSRRPSAATATGTSARNGNAGQGGHSRNVSFSGLLAAHSRNPSSTSYAIQSPNSMMFGDSRHPHSLPSSSFFDPPPVYVFLVDGNMQVDDLETLVMSVERTLPSLDPNALVALVVYTAVVSVYRLGRIGVAVADTLPGLEVLSSEETANVLGVSTDTFVRIREGGGRLCQTLRLLRGVGERTIPAGGGAGAAGKGFPRPRRRQMLKMHRRKRCLGAAVEYTLRLLARNNMGLPAGGQVRGGVSSGSVSAARLVVCTSGGPNYGPGAALPFLPGGEITPEEVAVSIAYFTDLSRQAMRQCAGVDIFCTGAEPVAVASLHALVDATGGYVVLGYGSFGDELSMNLLKCLTQQHMMGHLDTYSKKKKHHRKISSFLTGNDGQPMPRHQQQQQQQHSQRQVEVEAGLPGVVLDARLSSNAQFTHVIGPAELTDNHANVDKAAYDASLGPSARFAAGRAQANKRRSLIANVLWGGRGKGKGDSAGGGGGGGDGDIGDGGDDGVGVPGSEALIRMRMARSDAHACVSFFFKQTGRPLQQAEKEDGNDGDDGGDDDDDDDDDHSSSGSSGGGGGGGVENASNGTEVRQPTKKRRRRRAAYLQFVVRWSTGNGQRIVRVVTEKLPIVTKLNTCLGAVDADACAVLMAKEAVLQGTYCVAEGTNAVQVEAARQHIDESLRYIVQLHRRALEHEQGSQQKGKGGGGGGGGGGGRKGSRSAPTEETCFPRQLQGLAYRMFVLRQGPLLGSLWQGLDSSLALRCLFLRSGIETCLQLMPIRMLSIKGVPTRAAPLSSPPPPALSQFTDAQQSDAHPHPYPPPPPEAPPEAILRAHAAGGGGSSSGGCGSGSGDGGSGDDVVRGTGVHGEMPPPSPPPPPPLQHELVPVETMCMLPDRVLVFDGFDRIFIWSGHDVKDLTDYDHLRAYALAVTQEDTKQRFPHTAVTHLRGGSSQSRYLTSRLVPNHKDHASVQLETYPALKNVTTPVLQELRAVLPITDDWSYREWLWHIISKA